MAEAVNASPPDGSDSFPREEYECKICYNHFDSEQHAPKLLACSHTFCLECLDTLHSRDGRRWRIGCPVCRHRTPVPEYRVHGLPDNPAVTGALQLARHQCVNSGNTDDHSGPSASLAASQESRDSCQTCKQVALTTGCVCAIFSFLSMAVLLLLGLVFVHNFNNTALFSLILTWLMCMLKYRPETEASDFTSLNSNMM